MSDPFPQPDGVTCPECHKPWKGEGRYRCCATCREKVSTPGEAVGLLMAMAFMSRFKPRKPNGSNGAGQGESKG